MSTHDVRVDDWVEVYVPAVDHIGPGYTTRGRVVEATPGHLLVVACNDGQVHWRYRQEVCVIDQ